MMPHTGSARSVNIWMPLALRLAGASTVLAAAFALLSLAGGTRELVDDCALGAFGLAVIFTAHRPQQSWALYLFGAVMCAVVLVAGGLEWWSRAGLVLCLVAFTWVLMESYAAFLGQRRVAAPAVQRLALRTKTQYGVSLDELSRLSPVLLVFLRQTGCTFCRETLQDLAAQRPRIEGDGVRLALVLMASEGDCGDLLTRYGLEDVNRVSDPHQHIYRAFGLARGRLMELIGPRVLWRGLQGLVHGHGWRPPRNEDGFQMPGVFLLFHGEVLRSYRHQSAGDRPDYVHIAQGDALSELSSRR
jgi:peroxiredoxin